MKSRTWSVDVAARPIAWALGTAIMVLALVQAIAATPPLTLMNTLLDLLGGWYVVGATVLIMTALISWYAVRTTSASGVWVEVGAAAANGLVTLSLTFTLIGISAGIASLQDAPVTPETVQPIVMELGRAFGRAFMTTIVGLPIAALLRAVLAVTTAHRRTMAIA